MSELQDRFEKLAQRGTPRGADAVIADARTGVEQGPLQGVDRTGSDEIGNDGVAAIGMEAAPDRRPRRHLSSLIAAAGVAATLFVGMLAFSAFLGAGGGSDSPEGAVRQLADAVSHEDPIAAADVLAPEEVRSLNQTVDRTTRRAQELELARSAAAPLAGLDLSVDGLSLSTETLADGYVKVVVSGGEATARTNADQLPPVMQSALRNWSSDDPQGSTARADLASLAKSLDLPTFVVTVERGGHWYVSAAYTALEYIREANDLPAADFGSGVRAASTLGADTPGAAVSQALTALQQSDWPALISLALPDELPVYDYRAALTQLGADTKTHFTIDRSSVELNGAGDTAKVKLTASGRTDSGKWSVDGGCFQPPIDSEATSTLSAGHDWCTVPPFFYIVPYFGTRPDVARSAEFTVVKHDGRWFVSAAGTVLDLVDQFVNNVSRRQLYSMLGVPDRLPSDGTLTPGVRVNVGDPGDGAYVYSFEAHAGDRFLALATSPAGYEDSMPSVLVYDPNGKLMRTSFRLIDGGGLETPIDGTYRIVIQPYGTGQTLTIWAEANAPESAKHPPGEGSYEGCEPIGGNGMSCSSSSSSSSSGSGPIDPGSLSEPSSSGHCVTDSQGATTCTGGGASETCESSADGGTICTGSSESSSVPTTATSVPGG